MAYDTGIADRLRKYGLNVVEIAGWQTRGSGAFYPKGSVDHHTAGSSRGNAPSLNICINGRAGLSGPLCNVLIGRDNTCYVIAAGRANHAGSGSWNGLSGNSRMYGIERENVGTPAEPWREDQHLVAGAAHAALMEGKDMNNVCRHQEWTSRKIDTHSVNGNDLRDLVKAISAKHTATISNPWVKPKPKPAPESSGPITPEEFLQNVANEARKRPVLRKGKRSQWVRDLQHLLNKIFGEQLLKEDGQFGQQTYNLVKFYQHHMNLKVDGIVGYHTWASIIAKALTS